MFGYLQIDKAELKVREYEAYKSVYNLDGAPLFKEDSTLDLEPVEEIAVKPARKVKRSLRHKQQKQ